MSKFEALSLKFTRDFIRANHPSPVKAGMKIAREYMRNMKKEETKVPEPWAEPSK